VREVQEEIEFAPNEEINSHLGSFYSYRKDSLINSLVEEFENFDNISDVSWIKAPATYQSNLLDRGQFI